MYSYYNRDKRIVSGDSDQGRPKHESAIGGMGRISNNGILVPVFRNTFGDAGSMYSFLRISEASALALHTVGVIARNPDAKVSNLDIASRLAVSEHHLAKVHQRLVHCGILHAVRGPSGGFQLARPATAITLMEIVEAVEGPFAPSQCLLGRPKCQSDCCVLGVVSNSINEQVREFLVTTTADKLATMAGE